ncbi:MAG TPA: hypothetical protein PKD12_17985 [Nitrospira sp.]|nr:hypothetical protein [Nitrospira sp.]
MPTVYRHAAARRDLVEQFVYLAEAAGHGRAVPGQRRRSAHH